MRPLGSRHERTWLLHTRAVVTAEVEALASELGVNLDGPDTLSALLRVVDALHRQGYVIVLKWDGERETSPFTAVVSGPPLNGDFYRRDDETLELALTFVLTEFSKGRL